MLYRDIIYWSKIAHVKEKDWKGSKIWDQKWLYLKTDMEKNWSDWNLRNYLIKIYEDVSGKMENTCLIKNRDK